MLYAFFFGCTFFFHFFSFLFLFSVFFFFFFFSSRRRHTRSLRDWSSDVCSSDLIPELAKECLQQRPDVVLLSNAAVLDRTLLHTLRRECPATAIVLWVNEIEIGRASCRERV